jgi:CRP-like cAMP-binding protein
VTHRDPRATPTPAELGLARVVLFSELPDADVSALAGRLRRRRYARGATVFLRGDPGGSLYIVAAGAIRILLTSPEGKEMTLALRGPGDFFGELALLDGEPRSADAIAQEPSELLLLQSEDFLSIVHDRPSVAVALLSVLSRRLRQGSQTVEDAAFLDVPARLAIAILRLMEAEGQRRSAEYAYCCSPHTDGAGSHAWHATRERQPLAALLRATRNGAPDLAEGSNATRFDSLRAGAD